MSSDKYEHHDELPVPPWVPPLGGQSDYDLARENLAAALAKDVNADVEEHHKP